MGATRTGSMTPAERWIACNLLYSKRNGGQGENRTPDASLFRAGFVPGHHVQIEALALAQQLQNLALLGQKWDRRVGQQFGRSNLPSQYPRRFSPQELAKSEGEGATQDANSRHEANEEYA